MDQMIKVNGICGGFVRFSEDADRSGKTGTVLVEAWYGDRTCSIRLSHTAVGALRAWFGVLPPIVEASGPAHNDLIRLAIERAVAAFSGSDENDHVFNAAGFAIEFAKLAGMVNPLDGQYVRAMLTGRGDVEVLRGGAHYRLIEALE